MQMQILYFKQSASYKISIFFMDILKFWKNCGIGIGVTALPLIMFMHNIHKNKPLPTVPLTISFHLFQFLIG